MEHLLKSNPGLSSRFNTNLTFEDYTPGQLGHIFGRLCGTNHYQVPAATRFRLLLAFRWLHASRDEHFGNGRLVRNVFENAIRRLANRVARVSELTEEILTTIEPDDVQIEEIPDDVWSESPDSVKFEIPCAGCGDRTEAPGSYLGRRVRCRRCQHRFVAEWGEPM